LSAHAHGAGGDSLVDRRLPPVTEIGALSMVAVVGGVVYMASYLPRHAPLWFAVVLVVVAAALQLTNVVLLARTKDFAWTQFFQVSRWALLAYAVIAGMIEFAFVFDHTRGAQLVVMTLMLALFMLNVPVLIGFTVARYQRTS
jgi:hypothetical protein